MKPVSPDTPVRRHERVQCRLPAHVRVAPGPDRDRVRLAPTVCDAEGWVTGELVDLSRGGAGLRTPVFLPRGVRVEIRVSGERLHGGPPTATDRGWGPLSARVQRTTMVDAAPTYLLGVSFDDPSPAVAGEISGLLGSLGAGAGPGVQAGA